MKPDERHALKSVNIRSVAGPEDLWMPPRFHVSSLHAGTAEAIRSGITSAGLSGGSSSPLGVIILGQRGSGKSHMLSWVREQVQAEGGYFLPVSLLDASAFWTSCALSMVDGLLRGARDHPSQLQQFLSALTGITQTPEHSRASICGGERLTRAALDNFIEALRIYDRSLGLQCQDTARALALLASSDFAAQDVAYGYLNSLEEEQGGERAQWGIRRGTRSPQEVVRDLSYLLAVTGPTVITIDQVDVLIGQSAKPTGHSEQNTWQQGLLLDQIAGGLMALREFTRRTLTVVACLPLSWELITDVAIDSVRDRFRAPQLLGTIPDAATGCELVGRRLSAAYSASGFIPPYPTWPIAPQSFAESPEFTPRRLLAHVDSHIRRCLENDRVLELQSFHHDAFAQEAREFDSHAAIEADHASLDSRFESLRANADLAPLTAPSADDPYISSLIASGLRSWIIELGPGGERFSIDPPSSRRPALHGRLRERLDDTIEDERHWAFRIIPNENAAAVINRIHAASTATGLAEGVTKRRLFLLRNKAWPLGPRTTALLEAFRSAGGITLELPVDDLRTLSALLTLSKDRPNNLDSWLQSRQPAHGVSVFKTSLPSVEATAKEASDATAGVDRLYGYGRRFESAHEQSVFVGQTRDVGADIYLPLEAMRQHVGIFAGSGSGKTVLIRRIIEECALQGVSTIVLDPNNDLARLGEPWPTAPQSWSPRDVERAENYHADVEVAVWTPRSPQGKDLIFSPLPDLAAMIDSPDEFGMAIDATVHALAQRARSDGDTAKEQRGRAILREALVHYIRSGGNGFTGFVSLLLDLPDRVTTLDRANKLAAELGHNLTAAMVNDPLLSSSNQHMADPGVLLTPPPGKRARVSVISMIGLHSDEQRATFVHSLQLALFGWIRRNPAGELPMRGLFVMDEAQTLAPSEPPTACTTSTLALVSQGRKYGLGLMFATQAPRGLHNRITSNISTQFFGRLNSPIQIAAAREMAAARGFEVPELSRLSAGEFYASFKGLPAQLMLSPMCLTYHPLSPLTSEEVVARARDASSAGTLQ